MHLPVFPPSASWTLFRVRNAPKMIAFYLCGVAHSWLYVQWQFLNLHELQRLYETITKNATKLLETVNLPLLITGFALMTL
jgi:hypothetical protein